MLKPLKRALRQARKQYGRIKKVGKRKTWSECVKEGYLWFNSLDGSTHLVKMGAHYSDRT